MSDFKNNIWKLCLVIISNRILFQTLTIAVYGRVFQISTLGQFLHRYLKLKSTWTNWIARMYKFLLCLLSVLSLPPGIILCNPQNVFQFTLRDLSFPFLAFPSHRTLSQDSSCSLQAFFKWIYSHALGSQIGNPFSNKPDIPSPPAPINFDFLSNKSAQTSL